MKNYRYKLFLGGILIEKYLGEDKEVIIPPRINGYEVKYIGEKAFSQKKLKSIIIPNTTIEIRKFAFYGNYLTNIIIPDSVEVMRYCAFAENELTSITLIRKDISLTGIDLDVFNHNSNLKKIYYPKGTNYPEEWENYVSHDIQWIKTDTFNIKSNRKLLLRNK